MTGAVREQVRLAWWGWLATIATSLSFMPALADKRFVVVAAAFALVVFALGVGLRALRVPRLLVVGAQLVVVADLLLMAFTTGRTLWFIPTPATWESLRRVLSSGMDVAQRYAAPAPSNEGLLLMVVIAVVVVAVVVDALAVGLRRVPLAGLALLALYTIPVAVLPTGVPFYWFVPGAAAFIALLTADERDRLASWGRLVSADRVAPERGRLDTTAVSATGRRISALAVSAAVALPLVLPAFSSALLDSGRSTGPGEGNGNGTGQGLSFEDPMVSLAHSLRLKDAVDLLEIDSDSVAPSYLRLVVLDHPGPEAWTADAGGSDGDGTLSLTSILPAPTGLSGEVTSRQHRMTITPTADFPADSAWLPVPFDLHLVQAEGDLSYVLNDQTVRASSPGAVGTVGSYGVDYGVIEPTEQQLATAGPAPAEIMDRYAGVPADVPAVVAETARTVTADADGAYEQALLLQSFFRDSDQFSYDLDAGYGYGYGAMADFLEERKGFCQHFAATMAMMARTLGIPSRVVVGFLQPDHLDDQGRYVLTSHNVHSWPELYFDGLGWIRFEPTPSVGAPLPSYARPSTSSTIPTRSPTTATDTVPTSLVDRRDPDARTADPAAATPSDGSSGGPPLPPGWLLGLVGAAMVLLLPAALRLAVRRARTRRPLDEAAAAESAWTELRDHVRDLRLPWAGSMTPRARQRAVADLLGDDDDARVALGRLTLDVERARYAASASAEATPGKDARTVMAAISRGADRGQRITAFLWPVSLLPDVRDGWERVRAGLRREAESQ